MTHVTDTHRKKRLSELPPPFVEHYAPYAECQRTGSLVCVSRNCAANWDQYYRNNSTHGYKDRHYIAREFLELAEALHHETGMPSSEHAKTAEEGECKKKRSREKITDDQFVWLLEVGCGVGNTVLPLLQEYSNLAVVAVDISSVAISFLEKARNEHLALEPRLKVGVHDMSLASLSLSAFLPSEKNTVPFVSLIFVLCSVPAEMRQRFVEHVVACLSVPTSKEKGDGGVLFFRDYASGDLAQERFEQRQTSLTTTHVSHFSENVETNTFARTNGTLSHFFTVSEVIGLFTSTGCEVICCELVERTVTNHKTAAAMERKWIQCRFRRTV